MKNESGEARELFLFATNDAQLYRSRITPIITNLQKKIKKGTYDKTLALKLWRYAADDAAKRYIKENGERDTKGFWIFTVAIRNEVSASLQDYYDEELHYGENPLPRSRAARPGYINKKSQITKRAPTARLKKRRAKNTDVGYFPNPVEKFDGFIANYAVSGSTGDDHWTVMGKFSLRVDAELFAKAAHKKYPNYTIRMTDRE